MMTFDDLIFEPRLTGEGFISKTRFGKYTLSIVAGPTAYSYPREPLASAQAYEEYEVAIWKENDAEWCTAKFTDKAMGEVAGWVSKNEIDGIIQLLVKANK